MQCLDVLRHRANVNELPCAIEIEDIIIPALRPFTRNTTDLMTFPRIGPNKPSLGRLIPSLGYVK